MDSLNSYQTQSNVNHHKYTHYDAPQYDCSPSDRHPHIQGVQEKRRSSDFASRGEASWMGDVNHPQMHLNSIPPPGSPMYYAADGQWSAQNRTTRPQHDTYEYPGSPMMAPTSPYHQNTRYHHGAPINMNPNTYQSMQQHPIQQSPPMRQVMHQRNAAPIYSQPPQAHRSPQHPSTTWEGPKYYFEVEFKRFRRELFIGPSDYNVNDQVKVEADRGEDLGKVIHKASSLTELLKLASSTPPNLSQLLNNASCGVDSSMKCILRHATEDELQQLHIKHTEEADILQVCKRKVIERQLPMNVIDAEYQFDHHKLTFFFEADRRIDFRELVRDLFAIYKTRIWLQQVVPSMFVEKLSAPKVQSNNVEHEPAQCA